MSLVTLTTPTVVLLGKSVGALQSAASLAHLKARTLILLNLIIIIPLPLPPLLPSPRHIHLHLHPKQRNTMPLLRLLPPRVPLMHPQSLLMVLLMSVWLVLPGPTTSSLLCANSRLPTRHCACFFSRPFPSLIEFISLVCTTGR